MNGYIFMDDMRPPLTPEQWAEVEKHWLTTVVPLLEFKVEIDTHYLGTNNKAAG